MPALDVERALEAHLSNPITAIDGEIGPFVVQKTLESDKKPARFILVAVEQVGEARESTGIFNYTATIMVVGPGAGGREASLKAHQEYRDTLLQALDLIFGENNRLDNTWKLTTVEELTPIFDSVNGIDDVPISGWRANLQGN